MILYSFILLILLLPSTYMVLMLHNGNFYILYDTLYKVNPRYVPRVLREKLDRNTQYIRVFFLSIIWRLFITIRWSFDLTLRGQGHKGVLGLGWRGGQKLNLVYMTNWDFEIQKMQKTAWKIVDFLNITRSSPINTEWQNLQITMLEIHKSFINLISKHSREYIGA